MANPSHTLRTHAISRLTRAALCILIVAISAGCAARPPAAQVMSGASTIPPKAPTASIHTTATAQPTLPPTETPQPTQTPTLIPFPTPRGSPTVEPSPTGDLPELRRTPPTLMLHRENLDFDPVAFMQEFIPLLQQANFHTVTYRDISREPWITATQEGKLFIITIDDIELQAPIDPSVSKIIQMLEKAGYTAVLGVITEGTKPDVQTVQRLKELVEEGWEIAAHTDTHVDLHELEKVSPYGARLEFRTCADKVEAALGVRPITLVLPYGSMVADLKILTREHVVWVVGINGGKQYRMSNVVFFVGRESPSGDAASTYKAILDRFLGS
jgi:peptidoglycan/xylan/chitin deacetylase (PgdA/CDA1 family)